ncbi:MAG: efflux RND transporter periplasmic adaptor subunit [Gammaproteobacteria bacterium]|nr:efflux RND transporter periplasmic adaptor subunit [Gammaproteobacteria bacterium]
MKLLKSTNFIFALLISFSSHAEQFQGVLDWGEKIKLGFPVTGVVQDVKAMPGEKVSAGQILASLDQQPFKLKVKKCAARLARIQPSLFDARLELDHAEELFERTVLSEVERLKIEAVYKELVAEENMIKADQQLAQWKLTKAQLRSPFDAIVINHELVTGQVISSENKGDIYLELARTGLMSVSIMMAYEQIKTVRMDQEVKLSVAGDEYTGMVKSIQMNPASSDQYRLRIFFKHNPEKQYFAGQAATVHF